MKILFLTKEEYSRIIKEKEGYIFRSIKFEKTLNQSEAFLGQTSIESLEVKEYEVWISDIPVESFVKNGMLVYKTGGLYYVRFESLDENSLEKDAFNLYKRIFELQKEMNLNISRIWNYIPNILTETCDMERYRQFNIGRKNAWDSFGPKNSDELNLVPAATGIGSLGGALKIGVIFSEEKPMHIQNPEQTNAFEYSEKYGPKQPMFSRATYVNKVGIFVSGTAAIKGENTLFNGDLEKQIETTADNFKKLLSKDNLSKYNLKNKNVFKDLEGFRIYLKDKTKVKFAKEMFLKYFENVNSSLIVHDDICRPDLMIEIEGVYFEK